MTEDARKLAYIEEQLRSGRKDVAHLHDVKNEIVRRMFRRQREQSAKSTVATAVNPEQIAARMAAAGLKAVEK